MEDLIHAWYSSSSNVFLNSSIKVDDHTHLSVTYCAELLLCPKQVGSFPLPLLGDSLPFPKMLEWFVHRVHLPSRPGI